MSDELPDHIGALREFLLAEDRVAELSGSRIFGGGLPDDEIEQMPRAAVLLAPAGGGALGRGYLNFNDPRVDVDCYGVDARTAWVLHLAVHAALKHLRRGPTSRGVLLHWARVSVDGVSTRHPRTDWPLTASSWQLGISDAT